MKTKKSIRQPASSFVEKIGNVKATLDDCFEFEEEDVEEILSRAIPHKTDQDGGYRAFIRSVNKVVGDLIDADVKVMRTRRCLCSSV